nr:hypothetical protein [Candidatus Njordarchaeum guaymaensis]
MVRGNMLTTVKSTNSNRIDVRERLLQTLIAVNRASSKELAKRTTPVNCSPL